MSFQELQGQDMVKQLLQSGLRKNQLSHAYLFIGPSGTGKRQAAVSLAQAVFCLNQIEDACGTCIECRKVAHGNHPRLFMLEPEGTAIKIDQIRKLQREFSLKTGDKRKIYVIEQAEKMTVEAANSLLKFLEEPASMVTAVLITENGQAVLPTIRSRTQPVPFSPPSPQSLFMQLKQEGFGALDAKLAVHLAAGVQGARELIQGNGFAECRNVVIQLAKECVTAPFASASLTIQQKIVKAALTDHIPLMLDMLLLWFKDMLRAQAGAEADRIIFEDESDWIRQHARYMDTSRMVRWMEETVEAKRQLRSHVSPQLVLEQLCVKIKGE
ncbi:DNA polymerase III subunit delta' [Marinicrinis sediminis]|uniref:DNA polymerase III subunit delta' n=1 Tax=Marinicrinis sediminis TaxID=1652465 RepID=A0ABW5RBV5_9BACL